MTERYALIEQSSIPRPEGKTYILKNEKWELYQIFSRVDNLNDIVYKKEKTQNPNIQLCLCERDMKRKTWMVIKVIEDARSELEYLRVATRRNANREKVTKEVYDILTWAEINGAMKLVSCKIERFESLVGMWQLSTILGRSIRGSVHRKDLMDLAEVFGRDLKEEIRQDIKTKTGIHSQKTLRDYTYVSFKAIFGCEWVSIINGRTTNGTKEDLIEFGEHLWWNLKDEVIQMLADKNIYSALELLRKDPNELNDIAKYAGMLMGKTVRRLYINQKYELCEKLGWDIPQSIAEGITLYGRRHHTWRVTEAILDLDLKANTAFIMEKIILEISRELWYNPIQAMIEDLKADMLNIYGVLDKESYQKLPRNKIRRFGNQRLGLIMGCLLKYVSEEMKKNIGEKCGYT